MDAPPINKSNLRQIILDFPKQFKAGLEVAAEIKITEPFDKIAICGMGGSALAGALLKMIWGESLGMPEIIIWRNYGLPANLTPKSLVVIISYSGNTEETLSAFRNALNLKCKIVAISRGGKVEELAWKNKIAFGKIPGEIIPPRSALGYMFAMISRIFTNANLIPQQNIRQILETAEKLNPQKNETIGKKIAEKLNKKIPLIYASQKWEELAHNWKIKFNENAKIPAFFNVFPELHHNEMNAFDNFPRQNYYLKNFYAIILEDPEENIRVTEGIKIFAAFLKKQKVPIFKITLEGNNVFEKIFNNSLLADWTTYWLAIKRNIDPAPTPIIEKFKKQMAS